MTVYYVKQADGSFVEAEVQPVVVNISEMVDRFLCWKLPQHFYPDCHISFDRDNCAAKSRDDIHWPLGTNLFDATQAKEMIVHMLGK